MPLGEDHTLFILESINKPALQQIKNVIIGAYNEINHQAMLVRNGERQEWLMGGGRGKSTKKRRKPRKRRKSGRRKIN